MNRIGMRPIHPGEILSQEFMESVGMTSAVLAGSLNESEREVSSLVMCQIGVSADLAKKLSIHLKTTPEFWLNLQSTYESRKAQVSRS